MYTYRWNNDKMKFDVFDGKDNYVTEFTHAVDAKHYCNCINKGLHSAEQK